MEVKEGVKSKESDWGSYLPVNRIREKGRLGKWA